MYCYLWQPLLSLFLADWSLVDELRQHDLHFPLCEFLRDRSWFYSLVYRGRTLQPGTSAGCHCPRWLLQLDLQLCDRHDLPIHPGRWEGGEFSVPSLSLITLMFFSSFFPRLGWVPTCLSCLPRCCSASPYSLIFGSRRPRANLLRRSLLVSTRAEESCNWARMRLLNCNSSKPPGMLEGVPEECSISSCPGKPSECLPGHVHLSVFQSSIETISSY